MIRLVIFDLDGTLVRTEEMKAESYALAAEQLAPGTIDHDRAIRAFAEVVGVSRREMAEHVLEVLGLEDAAAARVADLGVSEPWEALVALRMPLFEAMMADPGVLRRNQWPHNVELLREARTLGCKTALATASSHEATHHVLEAVGLADAFDFIATSDDVERYKPHPEIYLLVASTLGVPPGECLVIEDSPIGVEAALAAGMWCIASSTDYTRDALHESGLLPERWINDDPDRLLGLMAEMFEERESD